MSLQEATETILPQENRNCLDLEKSKCPLSSPGGPESLRPAPAGRLRAAPGPQGTMLHFSI